MAPTRRTPLALLALAVAALLSSWNPASAPLGLIVGLLAFALGLVAGRQGGGFPLVLRAALVVSALATVVSGVVAARPLLVVAEGEGEPIVAPVPPPERSRALDDAAETTREGRDAARRELRALEPKR